LSATAVRRRSLQPLFQEKRKMKEQEYIQKIQEVLSKRKKPSGEELDFVEQAQQDYPKSAEITALKGDMIQRKPKGSPYSVFEAGLFYQRALELSPDCQIAIEGYANLRKK